MSPDEAPVVESTRKLSKFVLWLFAAVGFLAAVTQIASYLSPGGGELQVRVTPHPAAVQQSILTAVKSSNDYTGFLARSVSEEKTFFCDTTQSVPSKEADKKVFQDRCTDFTGAESLVTLLRGYDGSSQFLEYLVENTGSSVAREVRLSGSEVYSVDLKRRDSDAENLSKRKGEDFYRLPDLNPGEQIRLRVWSSDVSLNTDYNWLSMRDLPSVTFDRGKASVTLYKVAPSWYADIHDFLSMFPLLVSIIIVLIASTVVGLLVILAISVAVTLAKGEPISKVFEQPQKPPKGRSPRVRRV